MLMEEVAFIRNVRAEIFVLGKRHSRVPPSYPVRWRYKIKEHDIPVLKEHRIIQESQACRNEKKTQLPGQHERTGQVVRAVGVQKGETMEDFMEEVRLRRERGKLHRWTPGGLRKS